MGLSDISIRRPVFITSIVIMMLVAGLMYMTRLPVDLFPNITFPVVVVTVPYPGAGPTEVETQISKPLEEEISSIAGIKRLSSTAAEGAGTVVAEFTLETDIRYAEDQIRTATTRAKKKLPKDIDEPVIRRIDPADQPVVILSLTADLPPQDLYDLANETIRPKLEQVNSVGLVEILGGRKREIQVLLDRGKLKSHEISATAVSGRIGASGENIPLGKSDQGKQELVYRTLAEFKSLQEIKNVVLNFFGNDRAVTIGDVGVVEDGLKDEKSRAYANGKPSLFIYAFRQSGANTVAVVEALTKRAELLTAQLANTPGKPQISVVRDGAKWIRSNITDVRESIFIGIILAIVVVYLFLSNGRSTIITALALPNSLIGAFILMAMAGFSINIMTLLALSLSVGLLIDDAIVVRENIFRHLEMGKSAVRAAIDGTGEVRLAVIATTFTVIAVFGPVGFLKGVVGQFFREFGLTICFAMLISLFDALTIAPMLSAYFAGVSHKNEKRNIIQKLVLDPFERSYIALENFYVRFLKAVLNRPILTLFISFIVFILSLASVKYVPKTFLPPQDAGEFTVAINLLPGANLDAINDAALKVDAQIRKNPEVDMSALTVGDRDDVTVANFYVRLVPFKQRSMNTSEFKQVLRDQLKEFAYVNPQVKDYDAVGGGQRPFYLNILGQDQAALEKFGLVLTEKLKKYPKLKDVDINFRPGKPELQIQFDQAKMERLGISSAAVGMELRAQIDGTTPAKFRQNGKEYDIRVRLREDQRNLKEGFATTYVPNINNSLVPLSRVAAAVESTGPNKITRQDRSKYVQIGADITPGAGLGEILTEVKTMIEKDIPADMTFAFVGQAENFKELGENMAMAMGLGTLLIYFVLASLYESFVIPLTIMLALPLAICGSFLALAITKQSLNIFSWIGMIMLLGVSTKNSILLVDYANQKVTEGMDRAKALLTAGRLRLRPILMTTMALIAGTLPVAIGLNEASRQRTSMGIAIIGGLISSTLLTLIVIPASYSFVDRFRVWSGATLKRIFAAKTQSPTGEAHAPRKPTEEDPVQDDTVRIEI